MSISVASETNFRKLLPKMIHLFAAFENTVYESEKMDTYPVISAFKRPDKSTKGASSKYLFKPSSLFERCCDVLNLK
jgi:hypothetical protein